MGSLQFGSVLAVHPTASGFGWAAFDDTGEISEWGIASDKQGRRPRMVHRLERLLKRFDPATLVVETSDKPRAPRIEALYRAFGKAASDAAVRVYAYDREATATALDIPFSSTRYTVAQRVSELLPELSHRIPRKQKFGASEDPRQSLFAAAALALTYFRAMGIH